MKLFSLVIVVLVVLAVFLGRSTAHPKGGVSGLKKGVKAVKAGLSALSAVGTGHEIYQHVKSKRGSN
ncbi:uncharacterized protein LOC142976288 [Anticarsia gemmatalis]|uniref:uncharacterized protein LOC142976288 n=1 Tax=Anticarsia gemmatalis TaxID=129554 RepID=UPI003F76C85F